MDNNKYGMEISRLAQQACILEVCAPKPGNVNRNHDFPDSRFEDFLVSALAIGPAFEKAEQWGVGQIILHATQETRRLVGSNTNLGIILLLAPLARACAAGREEVRKNVSAVLASLDVEDARLCYRAIRLARPGGLGRVAEADIAEEPTIALLDAMRLARERDSIAREYADGFRITFEIGLPALQEALSRGMDFQNAIVHTYLCILSRVPDTLIARKKDVATAARVLSRAGSVLNAGGVFTPQGRTAIAEFDHELRDPGHTLNPGTTADLTTAAIFLALRFPLQSAV